MSNENTNHKVIFNKICQLAKDNNEPGLIQLLNEGYSVDFKLDEDTPIMLLARVGNHKAVWFLMEKFNANIDDAVYSAACSGHEELTLTLIDYGANQDDAVIGASEGGHLHLLNTLMEIGVNMDDILYCVAKSGHQHLINEFIMRGANMQDAVSGASDGGHLSKQNRLQFISCIDSKELRSALINESKKMDNSIDVDVLDLQVERRNLLIECYNINYTQADALTRPNTMTWILQGHKNLITEIYLTITFFMTGLSYKAIEQLFYAIHLNLFETKFDPIKSRNFTLFKPFIEIENNDAREVSDQAKNRLSTLNCALI